MLGIRCFTHSFIHLIENTMRLFVLFSMFVHKSFQIILMLDDFSTTSKKINNSYSLNIFNEYNFSNERFVSVIV